MTCLPRYLPRLAAPARLWFTCVGTAAERHVSFAEAVALTDNEGERAIARWQVAVGDTLGSAGRGRAGAGKE